MSRSSRNTSRIALFVSAIVIGATLSAACGRLPNLEGILTVANPCGTVFAFCQPADIPLIFSDSFPDPDLDPTCSIPGFGLDPTNQSPNNCASTIVFPNLTGARP